MKKHSKHKSKDGSGVEERHYALSTSGTNARARCSVRVTVCFSVCKRIGVVLFECMCVRACECACLFEWLFDCLAVCIFIQLPWSVRCYAICMALCLFFRLAGVLQTE